MKDEKKQVNVKIGIFLLRPSKCLPIKIEEDRFIRPTFRSLLCIYSMQRPMEAKYVLPFFY